MTVLLEPKPGERLAVLGWLSKVTIVKVLSVATDGSFFMARIGDGADDGGPVCLFRRTYDRRPKNVWTQAGSRVELCRVMPKMMEEVYG
jgi:hypothetical protein